MRAIAILLCVLPAVGVAQELDRSDLVEAIAKARQRQVAILKLEIKEIEAELGKTRVPKMILAVREKLNTAKGKLKNVEAADWVPTLNIDALKFTDVGIPRRLDKDTGEWDGYSLKYTVETIIDKENCIIREQEFEALGGSAQKYLLHRKTADLKELGRLLGDFPVMVGDETNVTVRGRDLKVRELWAFGKE